MSIPHPEFAPLFGRLDWCAFPSPPPYWRPVALVADERIAGAVDYRNRRPSTPRSQQPRAAREFSFDARWLLLGQLDFGIRASCTGLAALPTMSLLAAGGLTPRDIRY
jgi:hypothetical protein